jgi:hypothetical protein
MVIIHLLCVSESNSARAIGQGGVPLLLTMYADWHRMDTKNRHVNIRKAILSTLKHITNLREFNCSTKLAGNSN